MSAVVLPAANASRTSGHVIISNSTSAGFLAAVADCFAAAGLPAGVWAKAAAADSSAIAGIVEITRRITRLLYDVTVCLCLAYDSQRRYSGRSPRVTALNVS